jgi:hypothetical protein|tara:strand:- start:242 stop:670 length:429 start_codon:yes stop_codon:yes gene_type:complete
MKDAEIYPGKKITDLLEQIVNNCESEKQKALDMFERIQEKCDSEEQMMLIGPVAAEYLEIASKQTDNLIKCAETIRKYHALDLENDDSASLSEIERNELFKHLEDVKGDPLTLRQERQDKKKSKKSLKADDELFSFENKEKN